jgi:hypothetical protein
MNNSNSTNFGRQAQDFFTRSITEQMRAAQRVYDLAARFGRGELSTQALYDEYVRFTRQETSRYASDLAMLGLNFYKDWLALNLRYGNSFYEAVGAKSEPPEAHITAKRGPEARRIEMELHALMGMEAKRSFILENKRGGIANISFVISDFTGPDGSMRLPLLIQPDRFTLAPGQEVTVTLLLPIQSGTLVTGQRYRGTVYVEGYENLEVGLTVWVDESQSSSSATSHDPLPDKPTKTKSQKRKTTGGKRAA